MAQKLTLNEVKKCVFVINPNIEVLSDKYINSTLKLELKCLKCKNKWGATANNLINRKSGCPRCAYVKRNSKQSINEIKKRVVAINPYTKILSSEYVSVHTPLKCECLKCSFKWQASASSLLYMKTKCPRCVGKAKLSIDEIKKRARKDVKILSNSYERNTRLACKCLKCGNKWKALTNNLINLNTGCPRCAKIEMANKNRLTINEIKSRVAATNPNVKILDTTYASIYAYLRCKCSKCSNEWKASANCLINKQTGCPRCAKKESKVEIDFLNAFEGWARDRKILGGKELDAYFAKEKLAIEINGCFWHSTYQTRITKNYHLDKTNICESKGIKLLHFWDFEIKENFEFCKQIVLENLNEPKNLKDFDIKEVEPLCFELYDSSDTKRSNLKLKHIGSNSYEIVEFNGPNKQNLYDYFVSEYKPIKILTKLNRRFHSSFDNYTLTLGFKLAKITKPNYFTYESAKCYDCGELIYAKE